MPLPGKPSPEIAALHNRAFAHGVKVARILELSGISWPQWSRLKRGQKAQERTLTRLTNALDEILGETERTPPDGATPR